jgi:ferredoxin
MSYKITDDCTLCGSCEEECPNKAISQPDPDEIFKIDPAKCTECVGFFDEPQCVSVCPSECIPLDPAEEEAVLIARLKKLHPNKDFGSNIPSHFKK